MNKIGILFAFIAYAPSLVNSNVHLCLSQSHEGFGRGRSVRNCPAGLLFNAPTQINILQDFRNSGICANLNICKSSKTMCGRRRRVLKAQFLTGNFTLTEKLEIVENDESSRPEGKCRLRRVAAGKRSAGRKKRTTPGPGEMALTRNETLRKELMDETRRMLYFMAGIHAHDVTPSTQIAKLLEPSFQVIQKRCDPSRLDPMFTPTVLKAFLWLIAQSGANKFDDIPTDTGTRLRIALAECSSNPHPINVHGSDCLETISQVSLKKFGVEAVKKYEYDPRYVFQWGRYDPVVDAVWLAIDTIHGLCEPYFRKENLQHEYYVAMLSLLRMDRIQARWVSPTPLFRPEIYDQVFVAPMNKSLGILDACALGGSFDETYRRGVRPIKSPLKAPRRQRRSVNASPGRRRQTVFCLQSEQDRERHFRELQRWSC